LRLALAAVSVVPGAQVSDDDNGHVDDDGATNRAPTQQPAQISSGLLS